MLCSFDAWQDDPIELDSSLTVDLAMADYFRKLSPVRVSGDGRMVNCAADSSSPLSSLALGPALLPGSVPSPGPIASLSPPPPADWYDDEGDDEEYNPYDGGSGWDD